MEVRGQLHAPVNGAVLYSIYDIKQAEEGHFEKFI
jgi:hypothetical protein